MREITRRDVMLGTAALAGTALLPSMPSVGASPAEYYNYLVFKDLPLAAFGNKIPELTGVVLRAPPGGAPIPAIPQSADSIFYGQWLLRAGKYMPLVFAEAPMESVAWTQNVKWKEFGPWVTEVYYKYSASFAFATCLRDHLTIDEVFLADKPTTKDWFRQLWVPASAQPRAKETWLAMIERIGVDRHATS